MLGMFGEAKGHMASHIIIKSFLLKRYANNFSWYINDGDNLKGKTVTWWMIYRSSGESMTSHKCMINSHL